MPVSAILVVDTRSNLNASGEFAPEDGKPGASTMLASLEILGQSVVERTITRLRNAGVKAISMVDEAAFSSTAALRFIPDALMKQAQKGFDKVLLVRVGAYAEVDLADFLKFHSDAGNAVTRASDAEGPLDFWLLNAVPKKQYGLSLDTLSDRSMPAAYQTHGYVNRLTCAHDLRRLVVSAFLGKCALLPHGREVRPGVWMDHGARVHRLARIVAPAYIGQGARVRSSALVTRFSNLERCSWVDYGTVVEDSSVLPYTYIGRALDVAHAVVDGNQLVNLPRNTAVRIEDTKIIGRIKSKQRRFGYQAMRPQTIAPVSDGTVQLEPLPQASSNQRATLPILSKGEI